MLPSITPWWVNGVCGSGLRVVCMVMSWYIIQPMLGMCQWCESTLGRRVPPNVCITSKITCYRTIISSEIGPFWAKLFLFESASISGHVNGGHTYRCKPLWSAPISQSTINILPVDEGSVRSIFPLFSISQVTKLADCQYKSTLLYLL